jgi:hypothetical protein
MALHHKRNKSGLKERAEAGAARENVLLTIDNLFKGPGLLGIVDWRAWSQDALDQEPPPL